MTRKAADFYGRRFPGKRAAKVEGIRRVGIRELVDVQTTSGTFVAAGIATHNCYALTLAKRLKAMGSPKYQTDGDQRTSGPGFGVSIHPDALEVPRQWREPRIVFVNSMSDLFHARVPLEYLRRVFDMMRETPQHTYQVLTKRAARLAKLAPLLDWPTNVWVGVTVEDADHVGRVDHLRQVPAAVRFVSAEPLLGPLPALDLTGIGWLIVGGESGQGFRPVSAEWVRELRDRCGRTGTAFFFKQWGGRTSKAGGRLLDGRTWDQMPDAVPFALALEWPAVRRGSS